MGKSSPRKRSGDGDNDHDDRHRHGEPPRPLPVPDERVEFFFSVAVRDGVVVAPDDETTATTDDGAEPVGPTPRRRPSLVPPGAYSANGTHRRHLQWALHRSRRDGFQPAIFWRTPFLRKRMFASKKPSPSAPNRSSTQSPASSSVPPHPEGNDPFTLLSRHLSQFAYEFLTNRRPNDAAADSRKPPTIMVYVVSPKHLSKQASRIKRMWKEAAAFSMRGLSGGADASKSTTTKGATAAFRLVATTMKPRHFDRRITCLRYGGGGPMGDGGPSESDDVDGKTGHRRPLQPGASAHVDEIPVDALAALRGAGLLHGYPSLVFDCNPASARYISADATGSVLNVGGGVGVHVAIDSLCRRRREAAPEEAEEEVRRLSPRSDGGASYSLLEQVESQIQLWLMKDAARVGDNTILCLPECAQDTPSAVKSMLTGVLRDLASTGQGIVNDWLKDVKGSTDTAKAAGANAGANAHGNNSVQSAVIRLLSRRSKRPIVSSTGSDAQLLSKALGCDEIASKDEETLSPSPRLFFGERIVSRHDDLGPDSAFAQAEDEEKKSLKKPSGDQQGGPCAVEQSRFLIHHGIAASLIGHLRLEKEGMKTVADRVVGDQDNSGSRDFGEGEGGAEEVGNKDLVGIRVAKFFYSPDNNAREIVGQKELKPFRGTVKSVIEEDGLDWYFVEYDDGDSEHVSADEILDLRKIFARVGEARVAEPKTKKRKWQP